MGNELRCLALIGAVALSGAAVSCGESSSQAGPIERGLSLVPQEAHDAVDGVAETLVVDLAAASAATGIDQPGEGASGDELSAWFVFLAHGREPAETEVTIALPTDFYRALNFEPSAFEDEWGIDIGRAGSFAYVAALSEPFTVFSGDLSFAEDLGVDPLGTLGDGEPGDTDRDLISPLNRIGFNLTLGQRDGAVAISNASQAVSEWVDDEDPLSADEEYLELARALDDFGVVAAYFFEANFDVDSRGPRLDLAEGEFVDPADGDVVINARFDLTAVGSAVVDGEPVTVAAYLFGSDNEAESSVGEVEEVWKDVELWSEPGVMVDEYVDLVRVERRGAAVVAVLAPTEGADTYQTGVRFVGGSEVQFLHR